MPRIPWWVGALFGVLMAICLMALIVLAFADCGINVFEIR